MESEGRAQGARGIGLDAMVIVALRHAYAAVTMLESQRRQTRTTSERRECNQAIARWETTIAFLKEKQG